MVACENGVLIARPERCWADRRATSCGRRCSRIEAYGEGSRRLKKRGARGSQSTEPRATSSSSHPAGEKALTMVSGSPTETMPPCA